MTRHLSLTKDSDIDEEELDALIHTSEDSMKEAPHTTSTKDDGNEISFTCFPKLPIELRLKIWKDACFVPRFVDIYCGPDSSIDPTIQSSLSELEADYRIFKSLSAAKAPAVLHTSQEARKVGLEHYSLEFGRNVENVLGVMTLTMTSPPRIYVNWNCDVILPAGCADDEPIEGLLEILATLEADCKVRRLALDYGTVQEFRQQYPFSTLRLDELVLYSQVPETPSDSALFTSLDLNVINGKMRYELVDRKTFLQDIEHDTNFYDANDVARLDLFDLFDMLRTRDRLVKSLLDIPKDKKLAGWKPPKVEVMLLRCHEEAS